MIFTYLTIFYKINPKIQRTWQKAVWSIDHTTLNVAPPLLLHPHCRHHCPHAGQLFGHRAPEPHELNADATRNVFICDLLTVTWGEFMTFTQNGHKAS
jgi:hypothetical protein